MVTVNPHYSKLQASYLFSDIARRVREYQAANPGADIIRLGIGDVTEPLPPACIEALHKAVDEMGSEATFRGYGPEQGYDFLREAIAEHDFHARGADVSADEIFVSDGAKCDTGNIQELLAPDARIAVPDPVYPVYVDTNVMAGRTGPSLDGRYEGLVYLDGNEANGFVPAPPSEPVDVAYLCFPNNPTGATATRDQLKTWVDWALANRALLLFDAAYEAFIRTPGIPHSIYEIPGARECAVEFRSFSKTAGFTGTRCAFTVVPRSLRVSGADGTPADLHAMWTRRHTTKFNGVSYIVQRAAAAVYTPEGQAQTRALIDGYLGNAAIVRERLTACGYACIGGDNSPYIWVRTGGMDSWSFFDKLLREAQVVTTPGSGFGRCGEGYIRISAFNRRDRVIEAMDRLATIL